MVEFKKLDDIASGSTLDDLSKGELRDLQRALSFIGYNLGSIDGQIGPKTRSNWAEFVEDTQHGNPTSVTSGALDALKDRIEELNALIDVELGNDKQVKSAIAALCTAMGLGLKTQIAYILATAQWETNHTFEPVKEAYWLSEQWRKKNLHYYPYYGRGYVQLTWKKNYEKYGDILDQNFVDKPDLVMNPSASLFVIVHGCKVGTFTERKIADYVNASVTDYENARRVINGKDRWADIKKLAEQYEAEL